MMWNDLYHFIITQRRRIANTFLYFVLLYIKLIYPAADERPGKRKFPKADESAQRRLLFGVLVVTFIIFLIVFFIGFPIRLIVSRYVVLIG